MSNAALARESKLHRQRLVRAVVTTMGAVVLLATERGWSPEVMAAKPVPYTSVTVNFRCVDGAECASGDRVQGDPSGAYVGNAATLLGAFLNSNHDLALKLDAPGGEYLFMDFSAPTSIPTCAATHSCRRIGGYSFTTVQTFNTLPDSLLNPVDATGMELPNGLLGIAVNATNDARFKINFPDPYGRSLLWTVRYNPTAYPGSTHVTVRRTGAGSWTVATKPSALARLVSWASHGVEVDEGTFALPFQFTVTLP